MFDIFFYKDHDGNQPVLDYMKELAGKNGKDSRIKLNKIQDYIEILSQYGKFVLLHHFMKKTQKTPKREIEKAKRELDDLKERGLEDEK